MKTFLAIFFTIIFLFYLLKVMNRLFKHWDFKIKEIDNRNKLLERNLILSGEQIKFSMFKFVRDKVELAVSILERRIDRDAFVEMSDEELNGLITETYLQVLDEDDLMKIKIFMPNEKITFALSSIMIQDEIARLRNKMR